MILLKNNKIQTINSDVPEKKKTNEQFFLFQKFFYDHLKQGNILEIDSLKRIVYDYIEDESKLDSTFKEEILWYDKIVNQSFIEKIIYKHSFYEIIFHSEVDLQINSKEKKLITINTGISADEFRISLEVLALKQKVHWNYTNPFVSFSMMLANNSFRITLIHESTSPNKQCKLFCRSAVSLTPKIEDFKLPNDQILLIKSLIEKKENIIVSGSTGSGKTTFLKTLISHIPNDEHLIILEDTHELQVQRKNITYLLENKENESKTLKEYCAYAMRMDPDRIILGEIRSREVVPFILAMNTGHKGLLSTIHANSAIETINRLSLLFSIYSNNQNIDFKLIKHLILQNVNYVVHLENKEVSEIIKINGYSEEGKLYTHIYKK